MLAGLSGVCLVENDSVASPMARRASPIGAEWKSRFIWVLVCRVSFLRFIPTPLSFSFGPSITVPGSAYLFLRLSALECLTSFADDMTYYALC